MKPNNKILSFLVLLITNTAIIVRTEDKKVQHGGKSIEKVLNKHIDNYLKTHDKSFQVLKKIAKRSAENDERYSTVRHAIAELKKEFESHDVTVQEANVTLVLNQARDIFSKMTRIMIETCSFNQGIYGNMVNLPKLSTRTKNFFKTSEWVLKSQVLFLKNAIEGTLSKTTNASGYLDEVQEKVNSANTILVITKQNLKKIGDAKKVDLKSDITKAKQIIKDACYTFFGSCLWKNTAGREAEMNKPILENILERTEKFLRDMESYVLWLEQSSSDLKNQIEAELGIIKRLNKAARDDESLIGAIEKYFSGPLEAANKREIVEHSERINSAVLNINRICLDFENRESKTSLLPKI